LLEKYLHPIDENKEEKVCLPRYYWILGYCTNMATSSKFIQCIQHRACRLFHNTDDSRFRKN
jgi:hypothetical protein